MRGTALFVPIAKYCFGNHTKDNETGRTCRTWGGEGKCLRDSVVKALKDRFHYENLELCGNMILQWELNLVA